MLLERLGLHQCQGKCGQPVRSKSRIQFEGVSVIVPPITKHPLTQCLKSITIPDGVNVAPVNGGVSHCPQLAKSKIVQAYGAAWASVSPPQCKSATGVAKARGNATPITPKPYSSVAWEEQPRSATETTLKGMWGSSMLELGNR